MWEGMTLTLVFCRCEMFRLKVKVLSETLKPHSRFGNGCKEDSYLALEFVLLFF